MEPPSSPANLRSGRAAFTLVELVVVMCVILLLIGMSVPAFRGIGAAGKVSTATAAVSTTLTLARNQAIASRKLTRFVVVTDWPGNPDANYRKYSLWQCEPDATSSSASPWVQVSAWENLPDGVAFDPTPAKAYTRGSDSLSNNPNDDLLQLVPARNEQTTSIGSREVKTRYLEFGPKGNLRATTGASASVVWFTIAEGNIANQSMRYAGGGATPPNWRQVSTNALLGRATVYAP